MRRFSQAYLHHSRTTLWDDGGPDLDALGIDETDSVLDVGAGTGSWTQYLEDSVDEVVAIDADRALLEQADVTNAVVGDANRLPFVDGAFDLTTCQALLINLATPTTAIEELARVARSGVIAVEPNNAEVRITSSVEGEASMARSLRSRAIDGDSTGLDLGGGRVEALFREAGLDNISTTRHEHVIRTSPPYSERALYAARKQATGSDIEGARAALIADGMSPEQFADLKDEWRAIGRAVIDQMRSGSYERTERIPIYATYGHV